MIHTFSRTTLSPSSQKRILSPFFMPRYFLKSLGTVIWYPVVTLVDPRNSLFILFSLHLMRVPEILKLILSIFGIDTRVNEGE